MATFGFDTLKVSQDLRAAGFNQAQAKAIIGSMAGACQHGMIATKSDIAAVRVEIDKLRVSTQADIDKLRVSTRAGIADLKAEVFRALWIQGAGIVGINLAIGGLLFAAIRFLD